MPSLTEEQVRSDQRPAFIDAIGSLARRIGRLLLNGLAARASAVGGLPNLCARSAGRTP
ncbi:hypothetical protein [Sphingomonas adhaesiva]|uniref:hypothetical protein n=1 Tax=Sphingomonas adhaesiva TaxID=28212 RepID=UPI002FF71E1E